ncbi:hypothetical protein [Puia sp.]|uniref:hypothetical protein n=1 Tax=Puia sp. TaxID=2045100 RepID=UPI002F408898
MEKGITNKKQIPRKPNLRPFRMVLSERPIYLMEHTLDRACGMFGIKKEETACYKRKVERGMGWL